MARTLYQILGVRKNASKEAIKKAYREKSKEHHPDVNGNGNDEEFMAINTAYRVLSDDAQRRRYNETGMFDDMPNRKRELSEDDRIMMVISTIIQTNPWNGKASLLQHLYESIEAGVATGKNNTEMFQQEISHLKLTLEFLVSPEEHENDVLKSVIEARIDSLERQIEGISEANLLFEKASKRILEYHLNIPHFLKNTLESTDNIVDLLSRFGISI